MIGDILKYFVLTIYSLLKVIDLIIYHLIKNDFSYFIIRFELPYVFKFLKSEYSIVKLWIFHHIFC